VKKKKAEEINTGEWLNTYADMITLVLCFFVLLYSMSTVDAEKWQMIIRAFSNDKTEKLEQIVIKDDDNQTETEGYPLNKGQFDALGMTLDGPADFDMLYLYVKNYIQEEGLQDKIEVEKDDGYIFIRFKDNLFFNPDSSQLKKDGIKILEYLGKGLKNVEGQIQTIRIDGHTAELPGITNYPVSDRKLSSDRANSVLMYFEDTTKINPAILVSTGYGKNRPVADNSTAEGRAKNRRVEILIVKKDDGTSDTVLSEMLQQYFSGEALDFNAKFEP